MSFQKQGEIFNLIGKNDGSISNECNSFQRSELIKEKSKSNNNVIIISDDENDKEFTTGAILFNINKETCNNLKSIERQIIAIASSPTKELNNKDTQSDHGINVQREHNLNKCKTSTENLSDLKYKHISLPVGYEDRPKVKAFKIREDIYHLLPLKVQKELEHPNLSKVSVPNVRKYMSKLEKTSKKNKYETELLLKMQQYLSIFKKKPFILKLCCLILEDYFKTEELGTLFNFTNILNVFTNSNFIPGLQCDSIHFKLFQYNIVKPRALIYSSRWRSLTSKSFISEYRILKKKKDGSGKVIYKVFNEKTGKYEKKKLRELDDILDEIESFDHREMEQNQAHYHL